MNKQLTSLNQTSKKNPHETYFRMFFIYIINQNIVKYELFCILKLVVLLLSFNHLTFIRPDDSIFIQTHEIPWKIFDSFLPAMTLESLNVGNEGVDEKY